jgi:predicted ribosome quality control (RQC) complex YloA/Tae2 family protein
MTPPFSLNVHQMEALCLELQHQLLGFTFVYYVSVNKQRLFLTLQKDQERKTLFLCFQKPFLRFHLVHAMKIPKNKGEDNPALNSLLGFQIESIELLNHDRIVRLGFYLNHKHLDLIGEFFPKHPNYYLIDSHKKVLFSLYALDHSHYQLPPSRPFQIEKETLLLSQEEIEKIYNKLEEDYLFEQKKNHFLTQLRQQLKKAENKQKKIQAELQLASQWEKIQTEGELLKSHFHLLKRGLPFITVWDWTHNQEKVIELDTKHTPQQEVAQRFRRSKKLQAALIHLQEQLQKVQQVSNSFSQLIQQLEKIHCENELDNFQRQFLPNFMSIQPTQRVIKTPGRPYHEYESASGTKIWVGKNARDNDKLTFNLSNGSDWWLHTQDFPGSHIVIRTHKGKEPDRETLLDALQLALYYSKAKNQGEADVCLTQKKFVSRFGKGQAGKVQISKHRTVFARLDPQRYQHLKERKTQGVS